MMDAKRDVASSVCTEFYQKFSSGEARKHEQMTTFLLNHPSSRPKLDEWIRQEDIQVSSANAFPLSTSSTSKFENENTEIKLNKYSKCNEKSIKARESGNDCFKKKDLSASLNHYNLAIKFASFPKISHDKTTSQVESKDSNHSDQCLAVALANRSAVYNELGSEYYEKALSDADLALKYGYPENLQLKLLCRKAIIYIRLGIVTKAQECLEMIKVKQNAVGTPPETSATDNQRPSLAQGTQNTSKQSRCGNKPHLHSSIDTKINEIEMQIEELKKKIPKCNLEAEPKEESCKWKENDRFEGAPESISLQTSVPLGRHIIAEKDLDRGDVLFQERPFASVLLTEFYSSHCHHCHKLLNDGDKNSHFFPCRRCTQVLFCDEVCSEAADIYHKHECMWLDLMDAVGISHLAVRIILVAGVDKILYCAERETDLSDVTNIQIFKKQGCNYSRIFSLLDHVTEMLVEDLFQYALSAALLTQFLITKTSFLHGTCLSKRHRVGGVILRHICQLICNAHAVTDVLTDDGEDVLTSSVIGESQKRIATAIYSAASMMNHSCNPNIAFQFEDGQVLVVQASQSIKSGENIYNCYGPHFRRMPRADRQEILTEQYFFTCYCDKCNDELELGFSFAEQFEAFKCDKCEGSMNVSGAMPISVDETMKCTTCGHVETMRKKYDLWNSARDLLSKGEHLLENGMDSKEAIVTLELCYSSASKVLFKYNSNLGHICDTLARAYVLIGKFAEAMVYLKKSLEYVEARFGSASVEYTREFKKCEDVSYKINQSLA